MNSYMISKLNFALILGMFIGYSLYLWFPVYITEIILFYSIVSSIIILSFGIMEFVKTIEKSFSKSEKNNE